MSPRQAGSGTATPEADACAEILRAQFAKDAAGLKAAQLLFDSAQKRRKKIGAGGGRGFSADDLTRMLARVPRALKLDVVSATTRGREEAGDVLVQTRSGPKTRIEIKAQLTLEDFTKIQSADWIRDNTDFLGALLEQEPAAASALSTDLREVVQSYEKAAGWDVASLWVADVAGMTSRRVRLQLGVKTRKHLLPFLANKYFVHITQEGLRMFRLSQVPNLTSALSAGVGYHVIGKRRGSELTIWTRGDGQQPTDNGGIHMTYYLGQNGRSDIGGHHVHDAFFQSTKPLLVAKRQAL